jgi:hypothetical protein
VFKFALDVELPGGYWMYGGERRDDEKAMKAACNERKGLMSYYHCQVKALHFPLMSMEKIFRRKFGNLNFGVSTVAHTDIHEGLIHYRGFCLVAMSIVRIFFEASSFNFSVSSVIPTLLLACFSSSLASSATLIVPTAAYQWRDYEVWEY